MKKLSLLTMIALFFSLGMQAQKAELEQVSPVRAKLMVRNGAVLVDVREEAEVTVLAYDAENVMNVPLSQLAVRMNEIPKDKELVIACRSGNRSRRAIQQLKAKGYTNLVNLDGGIKAWQAKGFDVIKDGKETAKAACCSKSDKKASKSCCSSKSAKKSCGTKAKKTCGTKKATQTNK